ncbi:GNAT family N-acetyltransferase [Aestuariivirga litoralis]|uniref:GNAT family N-acetyltransferase n=1 Tax=Aestuariivirga litoralis TaxID=2650924 RepID=UPI0018C6BA47|nr:GNAT family N-acetyltransferase [Aestuariivirga litoralis]MBG1233634.1 GNAT family N-acetyltransferase [Aestuariivirga litoralis]
MPELELTNGYYDLPKGKLVNLVTCLEMLNRPELAPVVWPEGYHLAPCNGADLASYRQVFRAVGQDLMWFSRLIMPDEALSAILTNPAIESSVLMKGPDAVGLLELNFAELPDCELAFFGLVPGEVGSGLGRLLMQEGLNRAWAQKINRLWVHTCHYDHPKALSFYQKAGFRPYKTMIEVHDDPRLSGHLPLSSAPHVPLVKS